MSIRAAAAIWVVTGVAVGVVTVAWQYGAIFNPLNPR